MTLFLEVKQALLSYWRFTSLSRRCGADAGTGACATGGDIGAAAGGNTTHGSGASHGGTSSGAATGGTLGLQSKITINQQHWTSNNILWLFIDSNPTFWLQCASMQ